MMFGASCWLRLAVRPAAPCADRKSLKVSPVRIVGPQEHFFLSFSVKMIGLPGGGLKAGSSGEGAENGPESTAVVIAARRGDCDFLLVVGCRG